MLIWLVVGWVIWPGSFFLVALIGESRLPPVWKGQSKAFFPGDLTLPVMLISLETIVAREDLRLSSSASLVCVVVAPVVGIIVACVVTKVVIEDRKCYPTRAANSPTKIYHDIVGYYLFPLAMTPLIIFYVISHIDNKIGLSWQLLWIVVPFIFYVLCVVYDVLHPAAPEDVAARHPANWQPIWKK